MGQRMITSLNNLHFNNNNNNNENKKKGERY